LDVKAGILPAIGLEIVAALAEMVEGTDSQEVRIESEAEISCVVEEEIETLLEGVPEDRAATMAGALEQVEPEALPAWHLGVDLAEAEVPCAAAGVAAGKDGERK
jgi:hypothetical protein